MSPGRLAVGGVRAAFKGQPPSCPDAAQVAEARRPAALGAHRALRSEARPVRPPRAVQAAPGPTRAAAALAAFDLKGLATRLAAGRGLMHKNNI